MIRAIISVLAVSVLLGCASGYSTYRPSEDADRRTEFRTAEGSFIEYTFHYWERALSPDVKLTVSVIGNTNRQSSVNLAISVYVKDQGTFVMASPMISITADESTVHKSVVLEEFRLSVYGRDGEPGYFIRKLPTEQVDYLGLNDWYFGTGVDRYTAGAALAMEPPDRLSIILPDIVVNGEEHRLPPIQFLRRDLEGKFKWN